MLARSDDMGMSLLPEARRLLDDASARADADPRRRVQSDGTRGALLLAGGEPLEAAKAYRAALAGAEKINDAPSVARAAANAAVAYLAEARAADEAAAAGNTSTAPARVAAAVPLGREMNARAFDAAGTLPPTHETAFLFLTLGQTDEGLASFPPEDASLRLRAYAAYQRALEIAVRTGDALCQSYALGYTGHLYEAEGRRPEAERLTRRALFLAQQLQAKSPLYLWQWQTGRLLRDEGDRARAIPAFQAAVTSLRAIQVDLSVGGGNNPGRVSFRQAAGGVYYELADLLLSRAAADPGQALKQVELAEARDTVEQLKSAELQNYFQDRCEHLLEARKKGIESLDRHTAVVYYIPLADRVEILVGVAAEPGEFGAGAAGGRADQPYIARFTTPVTARELTATARRFRVEVRDQSSEEYFEDGQTLYRWLIAPVEPFLKDRAARPGGRNVDTLVFVPDGALRSVPMAALPDEQGKFLVERYALAVSPGLRLTDVGEGHAQTAGHAPPPELQILINGLSEARSLDRAGFPREDFPALKFVPEEVSNIDRVYGGRGRTLLNKDFDSRAVGDAMRATNYSVVHIASHGHFSGDAKDTFILAYNQAMDLDELERLIEPGKYRQQPVELLTLSACETAAGDDRAALGLAGVAVKAGALSALATLWSVNDRSSALVVPAFYAHLGDPDSSKAKALRLAQLQLMAQKNYHHPYFWSPYLLVGNWL